MRERNTLAEQAFIDEVANSHADFALADGMYFLPADELMRDFWLLHAIEKWRENGIALFGQENLKLKYNLHSPKITYRTTAQTDWFDLEIEVSFGEQHVSLADLRQAFVKKSAFVALGDGTLGVLPQDWLARFGAYFQAAEFKKNRLQIANSQFNLIDDLYQQMEEKPQFIKDLYARKQRLAQLHEQPPTPLPDGVNAVLRPYQQHGFDWLVFLHENQMGGCLADDMGLGKTLQTIVFLQYLKFRQPESLPNLIITPTSLIFNWENELAKFCPSLRVLNYTGVQRSGSLNDFANYDVVLTTYGSMVRDIDELKQQPFHYVILDESQAIKNPNSQRYKAVRLLQAWNRLALSGTPIENNIFDLYAQFNFLNPHLLGSQKHFKEQFANPIDKDHSQEVADLLSKMIQPFILRRTKEQVGASCPRKRKA